MCRCLKIHYFGTGLFHKFKEIKKIIRLSNIDKLGEGHEPTETRN